MIRFLLSLFRRSPGHDLAMIGVRKRRRTMDETHRQLAAEIGHPWPGRGK